MYIFVYVYICIYINIYIYIGGLIEYISKKVAAYGQFVLVLYNLQIFFPRESGVTKQNSVFTDCPKDLTQICTASA